MTEDATVNADAVTWVQTLVARGVSLSAHGKKLVMHPRSAYGQMSAAERATLKARKSNILAIVRAGTYASPPVEQQKAPQPTAPCPHCYRAPCIGEQHPLYGVMHPLTELQLFERRTTLDFMLHDYDTVVLCQLLEHLRAQRRSGRY